MCQCCNKALRWHLLLWLSALNAPCSAAAIWVGYWSQVDAQL
jgi:hypothetical protein